MVALAPNTSETSPWDVLDTFPKLHSRAREVKTTKCTEAPRSKSLSRVEIWQVVFESRGGLESFTRDPIGFEDGFNLYQDYFGQSDTDPSGFRKVCCKFRYGWLISEYTNKEIDCGAGKSAAECCKTYGSFPSLWAVEGSLDQPCHHKDPDPETPPMVCLVKTVRTVTTVKVFTQNCGKTLVSLHPVVKVALVTVCVNTWYVDNDPNVDFPITKSSPERIDCIDACDKVYEEDGEQCRNLRSPAGRARCWKQLAEERVRSRFSYESLLKIIGYSLSESATSSFFARSWNAS